jgi:L-iditol 2-dehydrogenase
MLMKSLQLVTPRAFSLVNVPVPKLPGDGEERILVRTRWVSMCGSDIPFFAGNKRLLPYPMAAGAPIHECIGDVVESSSHGFQPGDRVIAIPDGNQGMAELFLARADRTIALDARLHDSDAACVIQPLSTVMSATSRIGEMLGKSVVVVGLGSIGLLFCWLAKKAGACSVIGIDPCERRCRKAEALGATATICRRSIEVVHAARREAQPWDPPDICIEAVGHQMDTINDCLELVRKYGTVLAFGVPDHPVYAMEYEVFFRKNARLIAAVTPDWIEYLTKAQDLYLSCAGELAGLVTHRMGIRDAQKAFGMYERHEDGIVKAILDATCW